MLEHDVFLAYGRDDEADVLELMWGHLHAETSVWRRFRRQRYPCTNIFPELTCRSRLLGR